MTAGVAPEGGLDLGATVHGFRRPKSLGLRPRWLSLPASALFAGLVLAAIVLSASFAPFLSPYDPIAQDSSQQMLGISGSHLLGTDALGRDIFSRILYGSRSMLAVTFVSVLIALVAGTALGTIAGYASGTADLAIMRVVDVMLSFPLILLAITIVVALGTGLTNLMLAIGIAGIAPFTLLARSLTLSIRSREYLLAARCVGATDTRVLRLHVLPNIGSPLVVQATTWAAVAMLQASALNFLGFGVQPPQPDWGAMVSESKTYIFSRPELPLYPGFAITLTAVCLSLLGDGLINLVEPTARQEARRM
jgi:peptide/nickel transport system permease protein